MRSILSAFVLSTLALAAPMVHADEAKPAAAPAQSEKTPVKKSSSAKVEKKSSATKPAAQKAQPRRTRTVKRASSTTTVAN